MFEKVEWKFRIPSKKGKQTFESLMWTTYLSIIKKNKEILVGDRIHDKEL